MNITNLTQLVRFQYSWLDPFSKKKKIDIIYNRNILFLNYLRKFQAGEDSWVGGK